MSERKSFVLINDTVRANARFALEQAGDYSRVTISAPQRSLDQNAMIHAICGDIARSGFKWAGKARRLEDWKVLLVSAHAVATAASDDRRGDVVPGLEGEFVALRESTSAMGVARANSLISYALAWCDTNGIPLTETHKCGFLPSWESAA